jgi:hypothetical protein
VQELVGGREMQTRGKPKQEMQVGTSTSSGIFQIFSYIPVYYVYGNDVNIEYIKSQLPNAVTVKSMAEWNKENMYIGKHLINRTQDHHYFNLKTVIQDKSLIICGAGVSNEDLVKCVNHLNKTFQKTNDLNIVTKGGSQQKEELAADEESLSEKSGHGSNNSDDEGEETEHLIPIKHNKKRRRRNYDFEAYQEQKDLLERTQYRLKVYKKTFEYASCSLEELLQTRLPDYTHGTSFEKQKVQSAIDQFMVLHKQNENNHDDLLIKNQNEIKSQLKYMQEFNLQIFKTLIHKISLIDTLTNNFHNIHNMFMEYPNIVNKNSKKENEEETVEIKENKEETVEIKENKEETVEIKETQ